jgi:hypothetical protein
MFSSAQPAAPGWPSALEYTDRCTRLPKMLTAASTPSAMPIGSTIHCTSKIKPMPKTTRVASRIAPTISGTSFLSSRRWTLNASNSWRRRAFDAARFAVRASFFAALSSLGLAGIAPGYGRVPTM